jgi:hypothetical protein
MNRAVRLKFHNAVTLGKQGVIVTDPDKLAGTISRTALPDNDAAGGDFLATEDLHSKPL